MSSPLCAKRPNSTSLLPVPQQAGPCTICFREYCQDLRGEGWEKCLWAGNALSDHGSLDATLDAETAYSLHPLLLMFCLILLAGFSYSPVAEHKRVPLG